MSFSLIPPEVNSALMYSGAGAGPLLTAASAWDELAADLETTATSYQTAVTNLTTGPWLGAASARMAAAAAPYISWLQGTAAQAAQTGAQAKVAAAAYQTAYAAMVPPAEIAANRELLAELVSNNFLGQNTGAIATTEAQYLEMWIQDAVGMDTYSVASQHAAALSEPVPAPQVSDGGASADAAAAAQSTASSSSASLVSLINGLLADIGLGSDQLAGTSLTDFENLFSGIGSTLATDLGLTGATAVDPSAALLPIQEAYYAGMMASMPARMFMSSGSSSSGGVGNLAGMSDSILANVGKLIDGKLSTVMGGIGNQLRSWGSAVSASLASAHHLGGLSIPHAWHSAAPEMARAAPTLPATSVAAPSMSTGLPSSPFAQGLMGALAGRGVSSLGSRVAAKVMPRSPAGG